MSKQPIEPIWTDFAQLRRHVEYWDAKEAEPRERPAQALLGGSCPICGKPRDMAVYFGKRQHAYCKACQASKMREYRRRVPMTPAQRFKDKARSYANQYLKRGKIQRAPCQVCGAEKAQMHHHDYSKPLEVEWLCRRCHLAEHNGIPVFSAGMRARVRRALAQNHESG